MTFDEWFKTVEGEIFDYSANQMDQWELKVWMRDAYESGWNACADLNDSFTYDEVMSHLQEEKPL
jgi:hypothetical protein